MSDYNGEKECGNCEFWGRVAPQLGVCTRYPPQLAFAPIMAPTITGAKPRVDWVSQGVHPSVPEKMKACGEFRPQPEIVN